MKETLRQPFARQLARVLELYTGGEAVQGPAPVVELLFGAQARNPDYVRLIAWGMLTELLTEDVFADPSADDRALARRAIVATSRPAARSDVDARAVAALLLTATLGFQLFRPLLHSLLSDRRRLRRGLSAVTSRWRSSRFGAGPVRHVPARALSLAPLR